MDVNTLIYDEKIRPIDKIEFNILGNEEIKKISAFGRDSSGIEIPDLYDNMEPKKGGLIDTKMGVTSPSGECETCGYDSTYCPGHFAHIDLVESVYHIGFINFVKKILSCICLKCSKLLIYKNKNEAELLTMVMNKSAKTRFAEIRNVTKNVPACYDCNTPVSKIRIETKKGTGAINIISESIVMGDEGEEEAKKKKIRQVLSPDIVFHILANISNVDCDIMGINPKKSRPEMMIHRVFPVSPVTIRPSAKVDFLESSTKEDDLTHKLADIVKANIRIRRFKETTNDASAKYNQDHVNLLQYHAATHFTNTDAAIPKSEQRNSKPTKSLSDRLKGKEGRIRANIQGKRCDFSARTVITADPSMDINQIRVPKRIAMTLTIKEVVTPQNLDFLSQLVRNGRGKYPGANFVFPLSSLEPDKKFFPIDLRFTKDKVDLNFGDIVERHIVDDDYVLLNRQPTLHKLSMMGFRIKVINNNELNTFGLSVTVTTPFNADFDGDEMNIFLAQSEAAKIELEEIADVKRQIVSPALSVPVIGIVQDGLVGAFNMTQDNVEIDWKSAMNMISYTSFDSFSNVKKGRTYKGGELFSLIVPSRISLNLKNLEIKGGKIIKGYLSKDSLGPKKAASIVHAVWNEYGFEKTKKFLDNTSRLIDQFNYWNGFSVSVGDIDVKKEVFDQLQKMFDTAKLEIDFIVSEVENNPDIIDEELLEQTVSGGLGVLRDKASDLLMANIGIENNFRKMTTSGSKGEVTNMGQMGGCVGQQLVEGKRIPKKVNGRASVYAFQNDDSATGRGFVQESYLRGVSPVGFLYHNMGSREGLIDTAIKSVTGDTPIVILENNMTKCVMIGDWIDEYLISHRDEVEHHIERNMELLRLNNLVYIPTCDESGNVSWGKISAVTRHDPGKELYEIKTKGGREVIVTESKSLLIWSKQTNKFERMSTLDIQVGDYVPVTAKLSCPPVLVEYIDVSNFIESETKLILPEKIELNQENGRFIGLFLAEGNVDIDKGYVQITNTNINIKLFVKSWFNKMSVEYIEESSYELKGFSPALAKLLTKLVGNEKKFVPNDAFIASDKFIVGLIDGYFSGKSTITSDSIQVASISNQLLVGINMLLSRLGIFGTITKTKSENMIDINLLSIKGQWAELFAEKISLIDNKLIKIKSIQQQVNFIEHNDVVLDEIIEIIKIDVTAYPKVYDLTVPSTLNFGLANGLHVVDTAESGYIQRKLIKSLENILVTYDCTVRTSSGVILQHVYGSNGVDTSRQTMVSLEMLKLGNTEIAIKVKFGTGELKSFDFTEEENELYYRNVLELRDLIRRSRLRTQVNTIVFDSGFLVPVNIKSVISGVLNLGKKGGKLEPRYVIDKIEEILSYERTKVTCIVSDEEDKNGLGYKDEMMTKTVFRFALYEFLSPKIVIMDLGLSKEEFDAVVDMIIDGFNKALVEPGEMVGIVAAQSIGEPMTQMSVHGDSLVLIRHSGELYYGPVKEFIDRYMIGEGSEVCEVNNLEILGVSCSEKISWKRVKEISRHMAGGGMVRVKTKSGRSVCATLSHSFLKLDNFGKMVIVNGSDLKLGDKIPVAKSLPQVDDIVKILRVADEDFILNYSFGYMCGTFIAAGLDNKTINWMKNYFCYGSHVSASVFGFDKEFISGFLFGMFETDGYISDGQVWYFNKCKRFVDDIALLSSFCGLFGVIRKRGQYFVFCCKFTTDFGTDIVWDKIVALEYLDDPHDYVYDFTVPGNDSFMVDCGVFVHNTLNTFHHVGVAALGGANTGVPRIKELLSLSKNMKTPRTIIFLEDKYKNDMNIVNKIVSHIKHTTIQDIRTKIEIYYDPVPLEKGGFMELDGVYNVYFSHLVNKNKCQNEISGLPWLLRIELDKEKMMEKNITLLDIKSKFCNNWEKRYNDVKGLKKEEKVLLDKVTQVSILSNMDSSVVPVIHIRFDMVDFDFSTLINFVDTFVEGFKLKGLNGIARVQGVSNDDMVVFDGENQGLEKRKQNVIYADGVNMTDIRYMRGIDLNNTITNDPNVIYELFGIDAAMMSLMREFQFVMTGKVNYQHLRMLVDLMTHTGGLISIDRHGIGRSDVDPLARFSFEKTVEQIINSAVYGEVDHMKSVSSRISAGLVIKGGTGLCDVILDTELLEKSEYIENIEQQYVQTFTELSTSSVMADILGKNVDNIFMPQF